MADYVYLNFRKKIMGGSQTPCICWRNWLSVDISDFIFNFSYKNRQQAFSFFTNYFLNKTSVPNKYVNTVKKPTKFPGGCHAENYTGWPYLLYRYRTDHVGKAGQNFEGGLLLFILFCCMNFSGKIVKGLHSTLLLVNSNI